MHKFGDCRFYEKICNDLIQISFVDDFRDRRRNETHVNNIKVFTIKIQI